MMKKSRLSMLALLLALFIPTWASHAQNKIPTRTEFRESTAKLQTEITQWQHSADRLKVEDLPVSYALGKVIDQHLTILNADLGLASRLASRVLADDHLADEIALMAEVSDVGREFDEIANLLLSIEPAQKAIAETIGNHAQSFSDISNGPLGNYYLEAYKFVTARAVDIEKRNCSGQTMR
jgi:hypothetical protein